MDIDKLILLYSILPFALGFSSLLDIDKLIRSSCIARLIERFSSLLDIDKLILDNVYSLESFVLGLCWILINLYRCREGFKGRSGFSSLLDIDKLIPHFGGRTRQTGFSSLLDIDKLIRYY